MTVQPRDNVTLNCSTGKGQSMGIYTMLWYRQTHYGQPIEFIIKEYEEPTQNFKVILNTKDNMFSLLVSNLSVKDSATYYCAARHSENKTVYSLTINLQKLTPGLRKCLKISVLASLCDSVLFIAL